MSTTTLTRTAARICPPWCVRDLIDPDGSVLHESGTTTVTAAGGSGMVGGTVCLKLNRYDESGRAGTAGVCLTSSSDGIDLSAAEMLQLAAAAQLLAGQADASDGAEAAR